MPPRAKSICRKAKCNTLIDEPGFCSKHQKESSPFKALDNKKTAVTKKFYSSWKWTKASREQRAKEPLCETCLESGKVKKAEMVHHEPPLEILLSKMLNPLDPQYLHSLCNNCHLGELREKKNG